MQDEHDPTVKSIGRRLRAIFRTHQKPLNWKIIDQLERLAEVEETRHPTSETTRPDKQ